MRNTNAFTVRFVIASSWKRMPILNQHPPPVHDDYRSHTASASRNFKAMVDVLAAVAGEGRLCSDNSVDTFRLRRLNRMTAPLRSRRYPRLAGEDRLCSDNSVDTFMRYP